MSVTRQRFHNATGTGELTTPSGSQPKARVSYVCMYYDEIGRQTATANYGTNGGTAVTRPSSVASRSDTILVTSTEYDDAGQAYKTIDPAGREDRQVFDDLGRVTKTIQNYVDGTVNGAYPDEDVTVEMAYNADGQLETLTAKNPTTGDQTTTYVYGTTLSDSEIATSTLKRAEIYPDSDDTPLLGDGVDGVFDRIEFCYNRQSHWTSKKDQNGSVHEYEYDAFGRMLHDRVTTVGSGVDDAVRRISSGYEVRGQIETLTSYDNATVGGGSVINQVVFEYDEHVLLVKEYQEHDGAKDANTPYVGYDYDTTASSGVLSKGLRLTSLRYPNGRLVHYRYGTTGSAADAMSRIAVINEDDSGSPGDPMAEYEYLGSRAIVQVDYPEPDIRYDLAHGAGDDPYDGAMDRFGRVTDLLWRDYGSSTDVVRILHGYDRAGNRLWREDPVAASYSKDFDELYSYDGMYQLVDMQRGNLNANKDALVANSKTFAEDWSLDMTGNWSTYRQDDDGDGTWELNQSRTHNDANEIAQIAGASTHVAHDRNGNMTKIPKPDNWSDHFDLTYDAWNRLIAVDDDSTPVAEYAYDARNFRVVKKTYDAGQLDETRHFFYNSRWQCLEERVDSSTDADRQFAWGRRYIDDLALRDRDTSEPKDGSLDERLYALQGSNWNVVAVCSHFGAVQRRFAYAAYGKSPAYTGAYERGDNSNQDFAHRFAGSERDTAVGSYYNRARDLWSWLGRFQSRDSLSDCSSETNCYTYVGANPILFTDPTGHLAFSHTVEDAPALNCSLGFDMDVLHTLSSEAPTIFVNGSQTWQTNDVRTFALESKDGKCQWVQAAARVLDVVDLSGRRTPIKSTDHISLRQNPNKQASVCFLTQVTHKRKGLRPFVKNDKGIRFSEGRLPVGTYEANDEQWTDAAQMGAPYLEAVVTYMYVDRSVCACCAKEQVEKAARIFREIWGSALGRNTGVLEYVKYSGLDQWWAMCGRPTTS